MLGTDFLNGATQDTREARVIYGLLLKVGRRFKEFKFGCHISQWSS